MFKNQIKSLLAHRACVSVARRTVQKKASSASEQGRYQLCCMLPKQPSAGLINPRTARANMSRLQPLPYGSHSLLWVRVVL